MASPALPEAINIPSPTKNRQHISDAEPASGSSSTDHGTDGPSAKESAESALIREVHAEIERHQQLVSRESYLQRTVSAAYNPAASTFHDLVLIGEDLEREQGRSHPPITPEQAKTIEEKIKADQQMLDRELKVSQVTAGALTTLPLLIPGPAGWLGCAAMNALNTARPADSGEQQTLDLALGAGKGLLLKEVFTAAGSLPGGYIGRALPLGPAQRALESTMGTHNYVDAKTGSVDIAGGLSRAAYATFNPYNFAADVGSFLLAGGASMYVGSVTLGALWRSPLAGTMTTGGIYGFTSSISTDLKNHLEFGTPITATGVLADAAVNSVVSAAAAAPGGLIVAREAAMQREAQIQAQAQDSPGPGDHIHFLTVKGEERTYTVHVPETANLEEPRPVIVMLHGTADNAQGFAEKTHMSEVADKNGIIVAYAEGTPSFGDTAHRTWYVSNWGLANRARKAQDVQLVSRIIDEVQARYNGDPNRTFLGGFSAGGMLAHDVARAMPEKVAAVAFVGAALSDGQLSTISNTSVSVLSMHGTQDLLVPVSGRNMGPIARMRQESDTFDFWRKANNIEAEPIRRNLGHVQLRRATNPETGAQVEEVIVKGAYHSWFDVHARLQPDQVLSASKAVVRFFLNHPRLARAQSN